MRIRRRNKKSPAIIEESFPSPYEKIKLRISADPVDLTNLSVDYYEYPEELGKLILRHFFDPAIYYFLIHFHEKPRGVHKKTWEITTKMKIRAPYTFCLIDYWLSKPQEKWPKPIKKVIKEFEDQMASYVARSWKKKRPKAHEVTAYIMERNFGKEREKHAPKSNPWTDDPEAFKKTYILITRRAEFHGLCPWVNE